MADEKFRKAFRRIKTVEAMRKPSSDFSTRSVSYDGRMDAIEAKLSEISHKLQFVSNYESQFKLAKLEERIKELEKSIIDNKKASFQIRLADRVSGVVGLKEGLTSENRTIKCIWTTLFLLGIVGTAVVIYFTTAEYFDEPTATKIRLNVTSAYDIPPLGFCPEAWMDAEKALSYGLSLDAFAYSLGYVDRWIEMRSIENLSLAQEEFFRFYDSRGYSSLLDYYKSVSIDLGNVSTSDSFANFTSAVQVDPDKSRFMGLYYLSYEICHMFAYKPTDRGLSTSIDASVKFLDKTLDTVVISPAVWIQFGTTDMNFLSTAMSPIYAATHTRSKIVINSRRLIAMQKSSNSHCAGNSKHAAETAVECAARCQNVEYKKLIKCQLFRYSFVYKAQSPRAFCNFLEQLPLNNWTFDQFRTSPMSDKITEICLNKCPPKCDRIIYQATLQWQQKLPDPDTGLNVTMMAQNESRKCFIEISMEHNAKYEGETLTLIEVGTYSLTELINNIGGTLGLFIGATLMTLAQMIGFLLEHCLKRENKVGDGRGTGLV